MINDRGSLGGQYRNPKHEIPDKSEREEHKRQISPQRTPGTQRKQRIETTDCTEDRDLLGRQRGYYPRIVLIFADWGRASKIVKITSRESLPCVISTYKGTEN